MEYKIKFENDPNATAPAQLVSITCPLDSGLDLATFKVGAFAFDTHVSDAGFNSFYYKGLINATEKTRTIVFVQATLDVVRSEARWLFQALDPNTGLPPTNPLIGFLPPNNGTSGQGYVTFQIRVKQSLATNTQIRENATIIFDENPPIGTSTIFHTVDNTSPTVNLSATVVPGGVLVEFQSEDIGSGVRSVDLYSIKDGQLLLIMSEIGQSAVLLDLSVNTEHTLTAVATDNVNNIGKLNLSNSLTIKVTAYCPENCTGKGDCSSSGICHCHNGYGGVDCSIDVTSLCEPPIIEMSSSNTTQNNSVMLYLSAKTQTQISKGKLSLTLNCSQAETHFSKGRKIEEQCAALGTRVRQYHPHTSGTLHRCVDDQCASDAR